MREFRTSIILLIYICIFPSHVFSEKKALTLNDTNEPPYTTNDGSGFLNEISKEAFRRAGVEIRLVKLPAERGLINADQGIIDGDLTRISGLESKYRNLIRVPELLIVWEFAAFGKSTRIESDVKQLSTLPLGHVKGWKIYEKMFQKASFVTTVDSPEQLFTLLEKNRITVALYERRMGVYLNNKLGHHDIRPLHPLLAKKEMFIYLNKKHSAIIPLIARELRAMKHEGYYDKIYSEKLKPYRKQKSL